MFEISKKKGPKGVRLKPKNCKNCKNSFQPKGMVWVYCSDKCFREHRAIKKVSCTECNKIYKPVSGRKRTFCSRVCYDLYRSKQGDIDNKKPPKGTIVKCKQCEVTFEPIRNSNVFCSRTCMGKFYMVDGITPQRRATSNRLASKYYFRKRAAMIDKITLEEVIKRDSSICHICNGMTSCKYNKKNKYSPTIDHVTPLTKGGLHSWDNVKLAHLSCNSKKNNRHG